MPVISLNQKRFSQLLGKELSVQEMAENLPWLGLDIEEVGPDFIRVEYNPNRIDFSSHAGIARALKGLLELEAGAPKYEVKSGEINLKVDSSVNEVRPYIVGAVIRNLKLDEEDVKEIMEMQEDLHWGIGRNRKKASIGVHNLDAVKPPFTYTTAKPEEVKFTPLDSREEMSLREVLEKHEKGKAYRHLIDWAPRYPLLIDRNGDVLSMPPIINGELTRVTEETRNLFIDVTGTDWNAVVKSLNVLVTALADMGGRIESVKVKYPNREVVSPDLSPQRMRLHVKYANRLLGLRLSEEDAAKCLEKCRLDTVKVGDGVLEVVIPPYRVDILHEVDLVEEIAIGYGYYRLGPSIPSTKTSGEQHPISRLANAVRQIMIGLGFTEVMNFVLTNERIHYLKMRLKPGKAVRLANPVSAEYSICREWLLPGLMKNLSENKHESYPQRLFEVSDVIKVDLRKETRSRRELHLAAVSAHAEANYTEIRSILDALFANLGLKNWMVREAKHPSFLEGRTAKVYVGGRYAGVLGEIHPEVLENFDLENPVVALEVELEGLRENMSDF
ncbi:phenylalanine--tRNA ligase subunit beta [Candidatus Bathyarchaeota archaeon]|nr:phenylalanine--tRNA ligase subunit beta [Candidatus Bathyarchaeota archaeon]